jgi:23S rRNA pseudouridine2605 synthase
MTPPKVPQTTILQPPTPASRNEADKQPTLERLHKYLARAGIASRRQAENLIREGRVTINGMIVDTVGVCLDPEKVEIAVDGRPVRPPVRLRTVMLHKPSGYVTTTADPQGRRKVTDLVADQADRLFPVGRLDYDATGLLLLTNDGELANRLMHPRYKVPKTYRITLAGNFDQEAQKRLLAGVKLDGRLTVPTQIMILKRSPEHSVMEMTIREGKYHQVKRMCALVGYQVVKLKRVAYGPLRLGRLGPGAWRDLNPGEVLELERTIGR